MINYKILLPLFILSLITTLLFVGQFYDHHGDKGIFIKHRPTFQQIFYPAIEEADEQFRSLNSLEKQQNEVNREFYTKNHLLETEANGSSAGALIQLTITLFTFGLISLFKKIPYHFMQLVVQFSINIFITILCVYFMLFFDTLTATIILFSIITTSNFITTLLVGRLNNPGRPAKDEIQLTSS